MLVGALSRLMKGRAFFKRSVCNFRRSKLGPERFRKYIHSFGLDEKRTLIYQVKDRIQFYFDQQIQQVTTAFGQGSTVTPIQLVQATAIANDGKMMKPYAIDKIVIR